MSGMNRVILVGYLGKDPELRHTQSSQPVAHFSMATTVQWKNKEGVTQEHTEWHRIVVWGKQGEAVSRYLRKGRQVLVEGHLQTRDWQDKEGEKRYTTEVIADNVQFLGSARDHAQSAPPGGPASSGFGPQALPPATAPQHALDGDVPF